MWWLILVACDSGASMVDVGVVRVDEDVDDTGDVKAECLVDVSSYPTDEAGPLGFSAADLIALLPPAWTTEADFSDGGTGALSITVEPLDGELQFRDYTAEGEINCPADVAALPVLFHLEDADGRVTMDADTEVLSTSGALDGLPLHVWTPVADNTGTEPAHGYEELHAALSLDGEGYPGRLDFATRSEGGLIESACTLAAFGDGGGEACP